MDSKIVYFKIENKTCMEKGYVEIYNDDSYMPDWYYWKKGQGYVQQFLVKHTLVYSSNNTNQAYKNHHYRFQHTLFPYKFYFQF